MLVSGSFYKLALQGKVVLHNGLSLEQTNDHLVRIAQSMRRNGCVYFTAAGLQEYIAKCTHRAKPVERSTTYRKPRSGRS